MKKIGSEVVKICTTHTASINLIDCGKERACGCTLYNNTNSDQGSEGKHKVTGQRKKSASHT